jgi:hypothetical protein
MSTPKGVIKRHFVFRILFHPRLINEVRQRRRVFVAPRGKGKSGQCGEILRRPRDVDLQLRHDAFKGTHGPFDFPQNAGQFDASLPNPPSVRT